MNNDVKNNNFYFYLSIIFFSLGISISNLFSIDYIILYLLFFTSIFLLFIFLKKENNFVLKYTIVFLFFIFGFFYNQKYVENKKGHFDNILNLKITTEIIVDDEVLKKDFNSKITARIKDSEDRVILKAPKYPLYEYGDLLKVEGYLVEVDNFKNNLGRDFDYKNFLKKDGIFYEIKNPKIKYISSGNGNFIKEKLFIIKKTFLNKIKKFIPDPESSLLGGLLLGAKENMDKQTLEDFRRTGVIHIVVLSGYNLTIIAEFIMAILSFLGFVISAWIGGIAIVLFAIMTGASATIIRATVMALIVIFAKLSGRESEAKKALFLAGFMMLIYNPMLLLFDPSFQLSFLATLGLIVFSPWVENFLAKNKITKIFFKENILGLRTLVAATIATSIFVAPLLLFMMGEISIISPLVNLLILIFVPITMLFGFLSVIISFLPFYFFKIVSSFLAFISYIFLHYDILMTGYFSKFPYATFKSEKFSLFLMILIYVFYFLIYILYLKYKKINVKIYKDEK